MTRVGILGHGFVSWGGGIDFLRNVIGSLAASGAPVELHVLLPTRGPRAALQRAIGRARAAVRRRPYHPPRLDAGLLREFVDAADVPLTAHEIDVGSASLASASRRIGLDVLLPAFQPLSVGRSATPWVGYLYDFQHRHLPHLFSAAERALRDAAFERMLRAASVVVVNSRAVANDAASFVPQGRARIIPMPFSPAPLREWFELDTPATRARYGIEGRYFIVCNQFWAHKDHVTAFRALAALPGALRDVQLVCTGDRSDYRDSAYFGRLMQEAQVLEVADRIRVLGLIPKRDQIGLLRGAIALVQPTLFEGGPGGGATYDAVSLGVPSIVSSIAVNLEIDDPLVEFFTPSDADELAARMQAVATHAPAQTPSMPALLARGRERRARAGAALLTAIEYARAAVA